MLQKLYVNWGVWSSSVVEERTKPDQELDIALTNLTNPEWLCMVWQTKPGLLGRDKEYKDDETNTLGSWHFTCEVAETWTALSLNFFNLSLTPDVIRDDWALVYSSLVWYTWIWLQLIVVSHLYPGRYLTWVIWAHPARHFDFILLVDCWFEFLNFILTCT